MSIWVLEEALGIKSLSSDEVSECIKNLADVLLVSVTWPFGSVEALGSGTINLNIYRFLKALLGENFIDAVTEFSPQNMGTLLW